MFIKTWNDWVIHRKEIRHKLTFQSVKRQVKLLTSYPIQTAIEIINHSISMGYQGLFPPKKYFINISPSNQNQNINNLPKCSLQLTIEKISGCDFSSFDWSLLQSIYDKFFQKLKEKFSYSKFKFFLSDCIVSSEDIFNKFSKFISEEYSDFKDVNPSMLKPSGKMFRRFLKNEFFKNNIPEQIVNELCQDF